MGAAEPSTDEPGDAARRNPGTAGEARSGSWTFLSNHAHVLLCLADNPDQTLPTIASRVGITTRGVQLVLADLIEGGYVERTKVGRRNHYRVNPDGYLRHPLEAHHRVADLITALGPSGSDNGSSDAVPTAERRATAT